MAAFGCDAGGLLWIGVGEGGGERGVFHGRGGGTLAAKIVAGILTVHAVQPPSRKSVARFHLPEVAIKPQKNFLRSILRVRHVSQQAKRRHQHQPLILADDPLEGIQVARFGGGNRSGAIVGSIHRSHSGGKSQSAHSFH